jgi:hypothetical protein
MNTPLMPQATAVWLIKNTKLSFLQIADFCQMHMLEVQALADGEKGNITEIDPVVAGQVTKEDITRCELDPQTRLNLKVTAESKRMAAKKKNLKKYVPLINRQNKPDAVLWLIKQEQDLEDKEIVKLVGTTKTTILAIRNKTYWNYQNLKPRDPVLLNLCSQVELNEMLQNAKKRKTLKEKNLKEQSNLTS